MPLLPLSDFLLLCRLLGHPQTGSHSRHFLILPVFHWLPLGRRLHWAPLPVKLPGLSVCSVRWTLLFFVRNIIHILLIFYTSLVLQSSKKLNSSVYFLLKVSQSFYIYFMHKRHIEYKALKQTLDILFKLFSYR